MKDEELKLEEIESFHTIGGEGEVVSGKDMQDRGEGVDATLLSYTLKYMNLAEVGII